MNASINLLSGLVIGIVLGVVLQRGRFCFYSAFRNAFLFRDFTLVKGIGVALALEMVGFQFLSDAGLVRLYPRGLYWGANIVGGFMFGVGMVLVGGCILGATYRSADGLVGPMASLVSFAVGGALTLDFFLAPLRNQMQSATRIQINSPNPTLPIALGVSPWFIIAPVAVVVAFFAVRSYRAERRKTRNPALHFGVSWPWWFSGVMVGVVGVISYPVAEAAGRPSPLAMTGGYVGLLAALVYRNFQFVGWEATMVIGAITGAAITAVLAGEWKMRIPAARMLWQPLLGGLVMGIGAVLGDGCNITTILIGVPLMSLGGILAGACTALGCCATAYLMRNQARDVRY